MSYSINFSIAKGPLFRLVSPHELIQRRDFKVKNDPTVTHTVVDPRDAYPVEGGEWLMLDLTDAETVIRPVCNSAAFDPAGTACVNLTDITPYRCFMTLNELGETDLQPLRKIPVAFLQGYEVETRLFMDTPCAIGDKVYVGHVQHPNYSSPKHLLAGLVPATVAGASPAAGAVGWITKLPADNGGWMRVMVDDRL